MRHKYALYSVQHVQSWSFFHTLMQDIYYIRLTNINHSLLKDKDLRKHILYMQRGCWEYNFILQMKVFIPQWLSIFSQLATLCTTLLLFFPFFVIPIRKRKDITGFNHSIDRFLRVVIPFSLANRENCFSIISYLLLFLFVGKCQIWNNVFFKNYRINKYKWSGNQFSASKNSLLVKINK